jgi:hypothetical protein
MSRDIGRWKIIASGGLHVAGREGRQHGEACGMRDQVVLVRRLFHSRFLSIGFTVSRTQQVSAKPRTSDQVRL